MEAAAAILLGFLLLSLSPSPLTAQSNSAKHGCPNTCGNLTIPYPFGIRSGCYLAEDYNVFPIDCDSEGNPPMAYWQNRSTGLHITNFSVADHELKLERGVAYDCYDASGSAGRTTIGLSLSRFPISRTKNMFTATGCDTDADFVGTADSFHNHCSSRCNKTAGAVKGSLSNLGYCQIKVPWDCKGYTINISSSRNHSDVLDINPCSYAFVAEKGYFNFSTTEYPLMNLTGARVPVVVEWSIPGIACDEVQDSATFACKGNATCTDSISGYRCECMEGYLGNPYLSGENGCQPIDYCKRENVCLGTSECRNDHYGFDYYCIDLPKKYTARGIPIVSLSSSFGTVLLIFLAWWAYKLYRKRRRAKLKEKYFKQNGGLILQEQLISHEGNDQKGKLFDYKELKVATNNFHTDRILGKGGQGTVYKGMLLDGKIIAIKKAIAIDKANIEHFINEVFILSQINHRNVVKLLGYCLECETPLLVYEFIPNGTLYQYIHEQECPISWEARIRIATEIAGALFYLHSSASIPIYHRDIKSSNILLDEKYRAKIADFGTSRSVAFDQTHVTTVVQGTFGYLDPEYFQSSQFTDKSDVYSFGVVLVELLTGQKPLSLVRANEGRSLATYFVISMDGNHLFDILDALVLEQGKKEEIVAVANLAKRCLNLKGRKRPTMKEVVLELEGIRKSAHGASMIEETQQDTEWNVMEAGTSGASSGHGHETECTTISISDDHPLLPTHTW
ncbi:hypothetical protein SAY87_018830 [Trapa incisa]|uniref:Protein kinase domain-containing protein n=1 Tax=Trapa incisa TaxID=236973 RepID=A0AAN7K3H7_9MYRT|nr:hypothetical protein SAY87_018830 [Trapa incisa]